MINKGQITTEILTCVYVKNAKCKYGYKVCMKQCIIFFHNKMIFALAKPLLTKSCYEEHKMKKHFKFTKSYFSTTFKFYHLISIDNFFCQIVEYSDGSFPFYDFPLDGVCCC